MRNGRLMRGNPRRLAMLFLTVVVPPAVALVWLGLRFLQQDEALEAQREVERRQTSAQFVANALERRLTTAERWFTAGTVPEFVVRLSTSARGLRAYPPDRVLWVPVPGMLREAAAREFEDVEALEYRGQGGRALERYEAMARSGSASLRAGALVRVARVYRRAERTDAALDAYRRLGTIDGVAIDGMPADLLARRAVCAVLEETGRTQELARESATLAAEFLAGRWALDRTSWELTADQLERWTHDTLRPSPDRSTFSHVAQRLFEDQGGRLPPWPAVTRSVVVVNGTTATVLRRRSVSGESDALVILPALVETWLRDSVASLPPGDAVSVISESGETVAGPTSRSGHDVLRISAATTGLPWALVLETGQAPWQALALARRRQLMLAGLAAVIVLISAGSLVLWRVIQRDLAMARLQTDFVAAVSHEFRTPLASLRHVTELLAEDDNLPADRRRAFYEMLERNTARLHRLVESVLDFARMETGRKPFVLQRVNLHELTERVVHDFCQDAKADGFSIAYESTAGPAAYSLADASSLTHALWNLLDNAVKYSPDQRAIHVTVAPHSAGVAISVRDVGLGIPRAEQRDVFRKFVRGRQAAHLGIKGTGLGLAIVDHVVRAHGGAIELESEEGVGSTFRVVLPAAES